MKHRFTWPLMVLITALTVFSVMVVWPGWPKQYLPDFIDYPEGPLLDVGNDAMRLGLDLKGGTYVLAEGDLSVLPPGTDIDGAMDGAKNIIEDRINRFGVSETEVTREGKNRLAIQLPGIPPDEAADLIGRTALLAFREPLLDESGKIVCETAEGTRFAISPVAGGQTSNPQEVQDSDGKKSLQCTGEGGEIGEVVWVPATGVVDGETRALTGRQLVAGKAKADILPQQGNSVLLELTGEGSQLFEQITGRLAPDKPLGIFLDQDLISAPNVNEQLSQNQVVISNMESLDAAKTLAIQLNAGALPIPLRTIQTAEVDATLGEETLVRGVQAGLIGILAVMAFMILYYRLPGVLASMALFTYIAVVMMIFKLGPVIGPVTVTLAGIAGFVLSVGMAVDANVLVFERLREELRGGRNLAQAIEHGFDRAWSSIRDSNIATLITCAILWWFGDQFNAQQVEGFAITLAIGVLISLFSAIIVTRTLLRAVLYTPLARRISWFAPGIGKAREAAPKPFYFDFVKRRGVYFLISAVILIPGIISLIVPPRMQPGIEFSSGATFTLDFADDSISESDVRGAFAGAGHSEARVQRTSDGNYIIRINELEAASGPPIGISPPSERDDLEAQIEEQLGEFTVLNFNQVSEIVSSEIVRNALIAVVFASLAILGYISFSFRNVPKAYRYGIAAVVAALHDAVFVLGIFSIFGKAFGTEVDSLFITGILTVIGFSVHDTIVVFDRIRENQALNPNAPFDEVVNASLTETVARSINTSFTVLLTIVSLLLLGSGSIDVLLWTLLIGIIAGTYSSIFIASQILVAWEDGDFSRVWRSITPWRERPAPVEATGSS